ncbi:MAG: alpha/beta fold hydrolase [Acidimicrobiia bacterium]
MNSMIEVDNSTVENRRRILRSRFAVAIFGAALITVAACSGDGRTDANVTGAGASAASATTEQPASSTTRTPFASTTVASTDETGTTVVTSDVAAARPSETVDELVDIEGGRVHVRCVGSGDTTVLLIAGFESGDDSWGKVEPDIAARARVCSYARPGTGTSDPAVSTQTFATQATQLSALLATIGEPGPYVVVGHSFGGAEAITFASLYADQVTGLVLIDASPATWPTELCAVADDGSESAAFVRSNCAGWADPTGNVEHLDVFASFKEVAGIESLGSLPMTVITAVDRQFPGLAAAELARLTEAWNQGQQRWSDLSSTSQVVPVEDTSHHIELDRPDVVIEAILRLLP